jgi:hypothetical protein
LRLKLGNAQLQAIAFSQQFGEKSLKLAITSQQLALKFCRWLHLRKMRQNLELGKRGGAERLHRILLLYSAFSLLMPSRFLMPLGSLQFSLPNH